MSIVYKLTVRLFWILISVLSLYSCYSGRKSQASKTIAATSAVLMQETKEVTDISASKEQQLADENIDTTINNRIVEKMGRYEAELADIKNKISVTDSLLKKGSKFRRNYKEVVMPSLADMDSFTAKAEARMIKYRMIKEAIAQSKKRLYEMAAFFGPGKYEIPQDKADMANALFAPVIDSLINFSNSYSAIDQTGTIVVNGYADGMDINDSSELHGLLLAALNKTSASKEQLNMQLSQLRADAISALMEKLVFAKQGQFASWDKFIINMFEYGQGETYPTKTIKDYTTDDERRRVVLLYWCVLPKD